MKLATVCEVPTPWLCLQHDLRLAGIDPDSIHRITDQTMGRNVEALKAGEVDVIQVFEPFPSLLLADKAAHIWYEAARRGPTSYTTFYTRRGTLTKRRDELTRMVRAIAKTATWVASASGAEIADAIAPYFSDLPHPILEAACTRYKALEIWNTTPILPRAGYDRLRDGLVSGGFVSPGTSFETAVDNSLAEEALGVYVLDRATGPMCLARQRLGKARSSRRRPSFIPRGRRAEIEAIGESVLDHAHGEVVVEPRRSNRSAGRRSAWCTGRAARQSQSQPVNRCKGRHQAIAARGQRVMSFAALRPGDAMPIMPPAVAWPGSQGAIAATRRAVAIILTDSQAVSQPQAKVPGRPPVSSSFAQVGFMASTSASSSAARARMAGTLGSLPISGARMPHNATCGFSPHVWLSSPETRRPSLSQLLTILPQLRLWAARSQPLDMSQSFTRTQMLRSSRL